MNYALRWAIDAAAISPAEVQPSPRSVTSPVDRP